MLKLTFVDNDVGVTYQDAIHRATLGLLDILTHEMLIIVKVYPSVLRATQFPHTPLTRELIYVTADDVEQRFASLLGAVTPVASLRTEIDSFLQTINPLSEESKYPNCRFNYSMATPI